MNTATPTATAQTLDLPGHWRDANGSQVPLAKVKEIDQVRTALVRNLCGLAELQSITLSDFKAVAMQELAAFMALSLEQYGVKTGGDKGNVTLVTFDGQYKVTRQMADTIVFGEQLMAAKLLIDECVHEWSVGSSDNIKVLVLQAFQTDKVGKINTSRVLGLRRLDIKDPKWLLAMQAIADSIQTASTKPYVRFYKRCEATGEYVAISLDVAGA